MRNCSICNPYVYLSHIPSKLTQELARFFLVHHFLAVPYTIKKNPADNLNILPRDLLRQILKFLRYIFHLPSYCRQQLCQLFCDDITWIIIFPDSNYNSLPCPPSLLTVCLPFSSPHLQPVSTLMPHISSYCQDSILCQVLISISAICCHNQFYNKLPPNSMS